MQHVTITRLLHVQKEIGGIIIQIIRHLERFLNVTKTFSILNAYTVRITLQARRKTCSDVETGVLIVARVPDFSVMRWIAVYALSEVFNRIHAL